MGKTLVHLSLVLMLVAGVFEVVTLAAGSRSTVIDFEGALVEGINKRPLDSFNQLSDQDKGRRKLHLYRKRQGFRTETRETLKEIGFAQ